MRSDANETLVDIFQSIYWIYVRLPKYVVTWYELPVLSRHGDTFGFSISRPNVGANTRLYFLHVCCLLLSLLTHTSVKIGEKSRCYLINHV